MPLYEYQCDVCGHRFEVIQKFSDLPLETCPRCGGAVKKLQSAPAFHLKGSGWYITDYAKKDSPAPANDAPTSESKGETTEKTAAAPEPKPAGKSDGGSVKSDGSTKSDGSAKSDT